jgi:diaminohydroxyphosphoribosylaminopyrimidine deaminase/5-amino-6-(5-phosphoribosylamino)uracil reductase
MRRCLALAVRGAGHVSPNPLVGAVLVGPDGAVLGEGWHGHYGGPHAEVEAVRDAEARGHAARLPEATLYVSLEPCSHHGKTPPCADLLVEKGIRRVVVAHEDPFPAVAGRGLARLRAAGVDVAVGVLEREAKRLNEAFLRHVATGRPLVTLKWAQTLDGQVATASGDSRWVSSEESRRLVHRWRAEADAVLVGAGTARADDPQLTVRLVEGRQPLRIVLDRAGMLPPSLRLFSDADAGRTVAVVGERAAPAYAEVLKAAGGRVLRAPERGGHLDLDALLAALGAGDGLPDGARAVQSILVEAGPGLATAFLRRDLADRLFVFVAPKVLGAGTPAVGDLGIARMAEARGFAEAAWEPVGPDVLFRGYLRVV